VRLTIEPDTSKVEFCKFRPRFDLAVVVGRAIAADPVPFLLAKLKN
jgi:hypothetical protein